MSKPGPSKGHGGRPRKKAGTNEPGTHGYRRVSVGAKSKGKQVYEHRAKAGLAGTKDTNAGDGTVVHHKDGNKLNNSRSNLARTKRKEHPKRHAH
jgi:hypothetical protein